MSMLPDKALTPDKALARCEALCVRGEQSTADIAAKLSKWGISREDSQKILQRLIDGKYVDDARYARAYVRDKFRFSGWGRVKIAYNLRLKGIDSDVIACALEEIEADEYREKLERLVRAKYREVKSREPVRARAALLRFAAGRGFESQLSVSAVNRVTGEYPDDE